MKKSIVNLKLFREYADFLLNNHLDDLVELDLKRSREIDLPILKYFENRPAEELKAISKKSLTDYLKPIIEGTAVEVIELSMKNWKADKVQNSRSSLVAADISMIFNVRKHALLSLLPTYTNNPETMISILKEIEDYFSYQVRRAMETFAEISQDELLKRENRLLEAQSVAKLGCWDFSFAQNSHDVKWSDGLYEIYGLDKSKPVDPETIRKHVYADALEPMMERVTEIYTNGGTFTYEYRIIRADGQTRILADKGYIEISASGERIVKGISQDITEYKLAEEKLKQQTEALTASNNELEAFCYTVSHDLRAPLRAIDGFGSLLSAQLQSNTNDEIERLLEVIRYNARHMGILIDSLLEFARLGRKELIKRPINTSKMVQNVIEACYKQDSDSKITFIINELPDLKGDENLVNKVWYNLISNALKFSSKSILPKIEIGASVNDKTVEYYVKDNGAGFNMEYAGKLFGVFQRLHTDIEFPGTGVGLATVQRIVEKHGGKVRATGEPGKGACFYFSFPYSEV